MKAVEGLSAPMLLFTEDEANELKRALKGFDSKKVNAFIQHLRHLCHALLLNFHDNVDITKYQRPSRTEHKDKANCL
jgi:hypothetical protein